MDFLKQIFKKDLVKSLLFLICIGIFLYMIKSILNLVLLTFLFAYLINSLENFVINKLKKYVPVKKGIVTIVLYVIIFALIIIILYKYIPIIIIQSISIIRQAEESYMETVKYNIPSGLGKFLFPMMAKLDIRNYTQSGIDIAVRTAANVGKWGGYSFIALMLSLFFILQKEEVINFLKKFENSKISGVYKYCAYFGNNFLNSFGKVITAQVIIAMVNTIISVILLTIMGFPKLLALGFMIFLLSLIPVAGVIISLVPLCLIAFKIGGVIKVVYVLIMVAIIHLVESYILNPKLMSEKTKLPIFFTFVILIVSEHFMGIWGLLLGIPLFMFIIEILGVRLGEESKRQ
ncbi:AI-2E family transporter [Clostridium pasteurianum]|uniref:Putative permease n=1 Tax=Clostridium pasteurianum BC1 TaxID=86416 RepID=R4KBS4_CLOPA|nr:AI-2E family transporter [Clostridium pasteurianum]AGK97994.1 putative permease [Clostridium pasteurianum BC1]